MVEKFTHTSWVRYGKKEALDLFEQLQTEGFRPTEISLTAVLNACSHAGLPDKAIGLFADPKMGKYSEAHCKTLHLCDRCIGTSSSLTRSGMSGT